jgi:hypothetical protein
VIQILRQPVSRAELQRIAKESFGDFVKAVVDVARGVMTIGGELHADEEAILLQDGSMQQDLWGINLYPFLEEESMIEFDSMINIRPAQGNRSRTVEEEATRKRIVEIVHTLIQG